MSHCTPRSSILIDPFRGTATVPPGYVFDFVTQDENQESYQCPVEPHSNSDYQTYSSFSSKTNYRVLRGARKRFNDHEPDPTFC